MMTMLHIVTIPYVAHKLQTGDIITYTGIQEYDAFRNYIYETM